MLGVLAQESGAMIFLSSQYVRRVLDRVDGVEGVEVESG